MVKQVQIMHIFWSYPKMEPFGRVNTVLHEVLRYIIPHNPNLKSVPRTRKWFEMDPSTHRQWLDIVQEIFIMEKLLFL